MQINVNFDQAVNSLPTGFVSAVDYVVNYFDTLFTNAATITLQVGWGEVGNNVLPSNALGASMAASYVAPSYASLRNALLAENASGSSTLPSTSPFSGTPYIPSAEAKALGLLANNSSLDGYVGFNNVVSWDYTTAAPTGSQYYLIGTIEHEITEIMGRTSLINYTPSFYSAMDLYRYSSPGVRDLSAGGSGSTAYFSVDNGVTNLGTWNNNPNNGDLGDWISGLGNDAANDYSSPGVINAFSASDITNMQALGWTTSTAQAAPAIASFSPDSGTLGDGITNVNVLTLTGTAPASSTVNVYDGATLLGTATANASGAWSFTTGTLSNGSHAFTATDTVSGTTSAASAALNVTVDTVAPIAPIITSFSPDSGVVGDHITNVTTLTLTGTAEANSTVKIYDGVTLLGSATANGSGAWTYTTGTLSSSAHSFTATATDAASNTSAASAALSVTIDTSAPVAPSITSFSPDSGTVGDGITNVNVLTLTGTAEANSTVKIYDGATLLGSATANSSGAWSYTTGTLASTTHSFTATATDAASNTSAASAALSVTIDTSAPVAPSITSFSPDSGTVGDGITNVNVLTLTGTAEANSTVKIYDGATLLGSATANSSGAWSYTTGTLTSTVHSFTATATDAASNTSAASAALSVTIDTTAPVAPSITSFSPDSGVIGDHITNVTTLTLTGTAEANSTVKVYDGATLLGSATANGSGAWSYTTGTLASAAHSFTATATDAASNTSTASAALSVTIDTTAPIAPVISSDVIVNTNEVALTGTAEANSTVKVYDGATLLGSVVATGTGAWTYTTAALANGSHSFTATATDAASNTGAASSVAAITVNTPVPVIASFSPDSGTVGDGITNVAVLALTGTAPASSTVNVYDGATLLGTATANASGAWSFTTGTLGNGSHSFTATDTVTGITSAASAALNVTVDTVAPVAPSIASFSTDSGVVGDHITNDNTLTLTGTAEANSTVKVYDGATLLGSAVANGTGAWTYTTAALGDGAHNLTATATDAASNTSAASAALGVTIDTAAPVAPSIASFSTDSGVVGDHITNDNTLTLTGTAEANSTVKVYDGATLLGSATANGSGAWTYTTAALADGAHNLTATATDAAANTSAASAALNVTVDTVAPVAPSIASFSTDSGVVGDHITNDNTLTLTGTAEANSTVKVYDGATLLGSAVANGSGAWTYTTAALGDGAHNLTATATDAAANTSAASAALTVTVDTVAPVAPSIASFSTDSGVVGDHITNDNTLTLTGTAEANSTVKVYDGATLLGSAVANGSGAWTYTTAALTDGAHNLTATATDAAANTSAASAALGVTIDTVAPVAPVISSDVIVNTNEIALTGTAEANSTVKIYDGAALLGSVAATATGAWNYTTAVLATGSHNLTATATDAASNVSAASQITDPVINSSVTIESLGSTSLTEVGNNFFLYANGTSSGPAITLGGVDITSGQFGTWAPIGAEKTATGYELAWHDTATNQYSIWTLDNNGNYITNNGTLSATSATLEAFETSFHQDLNGDGVIGVPASVVVESFGSTSLTEIGNNLFLYANGTSSGPAITLGGVDITSSQFGTWTPIGAEKTATGYELAWHDTATNQYSIWTLDSNGNYITNNGALSGTSATLEAFETSFHQDLNGDGVIGTSVVVESMGSTSLTEVGNNYFLYANGTSSGPAITLGGVDIASGQFGTWTPIGAEQTATGYELAWHDTATNQYSIWTLDSNGNYITNNGALSGTSATLEAFETSFHQDLNGDGVIGVPASVVVESMGSTSLTEIGNNFFLYANGTSSGPAITLGGVDITSGQFGTWTPIGAEKTATGYELAWHDTATNQYSIWTLDSNGNYITNNGALSGTSLTIETAETSFHQDLNGDGVIGVPTTSLISNTVSPGHTLDIGTILNSGATGDLGSPGVQSSSAIHGFTTEPVTVLRDNGSGSTTILYGTSGNDTIVPTAPNQTLFGNGGSDTFVFSGNIGKDTIADFHPANDVIQLDHNAFTSFADVLAHADQVGSDVAITIDASNSVTLHNTVISQLTTHNFHLV